MKWIIAALALTTLLVACSPGRADFPCRGRRIVAPCFVPTVCHEVVTPHVVHHAATVTVVQEPLPVFVFQNLTGFPSMPANVTMPQSQPFQATAQAPAHDHGCCLSDAQMDRLASMVAMKLAGTAAINTNTALMIPKIEDDPPQQLQMSQAIVNDIGNKCASCHMAGQSTKGGLALFDAQRNFNPTKGGQPYATPERLWQKAQSGEMPPAAGTDPTKRLNPETIAFLRSATGG